jgi:hypothetical protein
MILNINYSDTSSNHLYLPNLNTGHLHHYHHFLFGYLLPTIIHATQSNKNQDKIFMTDCGSSMNKIIKQVGYYQYEPKVTLKSINSIAGFDGCRFTLDKNIINLANSSIDKIFSIENNDTAREPYILLIDRGETPSEEERQKLSNTELKHKTGNERRSIQNMAEIERTLSDFFPVKRVVLEGLDFLEQVLFFRHAYIVIMQHGAAMSNMIFTKRTKALIEIVNNNKQNICYHNLVKNLDITKFFIMNKSSHSNVNCDLLRNLIETVPCLY